jgi:hypothetical protein
MLGAFMSGLTSGMESMLKLRQQADELRMQLDSNEKFRQASAERGAIPTGPDYGGGGDPGSSPDFPIPDTSTTGSGGGGAGGSGGGDGGVGDTSATGVGHSVPISERLAYYQKRAGELGLNYNAIAATVHGEGLHQFHGDKGKSFGDFQLYTGGGMGNEAEQAGVNIRDPNHWKEAADYALGQMAQHKNDPGWFAGQWHGAPGWAAQTFSDPKALAPRGWSVPNYISPAPVASASPPASRLAVGGAITGGAGQPAPGYGSTAMGDGVNVEQLGTAAGAGAAGLAPGFVRDPVTQQLTMNGRPPDTYIGGVLPGGGAVPAWNAPTPGPSPSATARSPAVTASHPMTQKQQYDADMAAGRRPVFPPGQKFNSRGEAIASDLKPALPGASFPKTYTPVPGYAISPTGEVTGGQRADVSNPDDTNQWGALA